MREKLKIVLTGGSGFVGQHLLVDMNVNDYVLTVLTRDPAKKMPILPEGIRLIQADLTDLDSLVAAFSGQDVLINFAAEVRNPEKLAETNIKGTENLIEAIKRTGIKKVIHLSSVGILGQSYSHTKKNLNEAAIQVPENAYERTKNSSENLLLTAFQTNEVDLIVLRPTNVFGPNHPFQALLNLMQHTLNNKPCIYEQHAVVNYVYVKDLTALTLHLIDAPVSGQVLHVGQAMDLKDFYLELSTQLESNVKLLRIPKLFITLAQAMGIRKLRAISNHVTYDDTKLRTFYTYPFGLKQGLKETIQHYREQQLLPAKGE